MKTSDKLLYRKEIAKHGNLEILKYMCDNMISSIEYSFDDILEAAIMGGDLEIVKWLYTCANQSYIRRHPSIYTVIAADRGHLEVLKYLHENGCFWDSDACIYAAKGGHLKVLQYLHDNGCRWNIDACAYAASKGGHVDVLKYLHENGCSWYYNTYSYAIEGGHLEVLKYLLDEGCPAHMYGDDEVCCIAARHKQTNILEYLIENGYACDKHSLLYVKNQ